MADTKLTALTELTAPALGDWLYAVDVSDTTDDAAGSSRKILNSSLLQYMPHGLSEISVTGATTATIGRMHVCSGTTADYTLTLPAASGNTGKIIVVRMATGLTKLVTIDGNASETIDGELTRIMWAGESAILLCDGSNWFKIGGVSKAMDCKLYASAETALTSASTYYKIAHNTVSVDNTGIMADTANYRIYCRRPGSYLARARGLITKTGAVGLTEACPQAVSFFQKNQTTPGTANIIAYTSSNGQVGGYVNIAPIENVTLVGGDYLHVTALVSITSLVVYQDLEYSQFSVRELNPW